MFFCCLEHFVSLEIYFEDVFKFLSSLPDLLWIIDTVWFSCSSLLYVSSSSSLPSSISFPFLLVFESLFFCSYEHPYLLADNRHYTFYFWKNIYRQHELVKYLLTPVYSVCLLIIITLISKIIDFIIVVYVLL